MSQIQKVVIVRYAEFDGEGILTRQGVNRIQTLVWGLEAGRNIHVFYLDWQKLGTHQRPIKTTAWVLAATLIQDKDLITPIGVTGETESDHAASVRDLIEMLHGSSTTVFVVVNSELSSSLAALYTKGWADDCVAILDPGRAHVLDLVGQTHYDL